MGIVCQINRISNDAITILQRAWSSALPISIAFVVLWTCHVIAILWTSSCGVTPLFLYRNYYEFIIITLIKLFANNYHSLSDKTKKPAALQLVQPNKLVNKFVWVWNSKNCKSQKKTNLQYPLWQPDSSPALMPTASATIKAKITIFEFISKGRFELHWWFQQYRQFNLYQKCLLIFEHKLMMKQEA